MKTIFISVFTFFYVALITGQSSDTLRYLGIDTIVPAIEVIGMSKSNKNYLRWAPNTASLWYATMSEGFDVVRIEISAEAIPVNGSENQVQVKKWPRDKFLPLLDSDQKYVLAAAQGLYGDWESRAGGNFDFAGRAEEINNRYNLSMLAADLDTTAAQALGLRWVDNDAVSGKSYIYLIRPLNDSLANLYQGQYSILTGAEDEFTPEIESLIEEENHLVIQWDKELLNPYYTGFWVEKREGNRPFERLNRDPIIGAASAEFDSPWITFRDSVPNYVEYEYRIVGISPFGFESTPSAGIKGMARDKTPPDPVRNLRFEEIDKSIKLTWEPTPTIDLSHFDVYRSSIYDGGYEKINVDKIPPMVHQFVDNSPLLELGPYYMVTAVDTAGNASYSTIIRGYLRDTIAPNPPTGLEGTIDSNGIVRLTWNPNTEADLDGYYVYFSNQEDHFFANLTGFPIKSPAFQDTITLKSFTEEIFYRVTAIDHLGHISKFSETLLLHKPDTLAPFPPSLVGYLIKEDHIQLAWTSSTSKDVVKQLIYKQKQGDTTWSVLSDRPTAVITDYEVEPGIAYAYKSEAIDDAGNVSRNNDEIRITFTDKRPFVAPAIQEITYDSTTNALNLTWSFPENEPAQIILYRSINDGPYTTLTTLSSINEYQDKDSILPKRKYGYKLKAVSKDGRRSAFGQELVYSMEK